MSDFDRVGSSAARPGAFAYDSHSMPELFDGVFALVEDDFELDEDIELGHFVRKAGVDFFQDLGGFFEGEAFEFGEGVEDGLRRAAAEEDALAEFVKSELVNWGKLIKEAGIEPQ